MGSKIKVLFDNLCVGDILFVESKDKAGILNILAQKILTNIKLKEDFTYSHVILSLGQGLFIESNTKNGVTILTCIELSNKIGSNYKDNYKLFRNKIIASNNISKRKIFMKAEYYYGQKYNKLFLLQQKRDKHSYCSQLIYNIYKDSLNLELKPKSILMDVFPIHIWGTLKTNKEWYETTNNLNFVLDKIKEYKEKYKLDFRNNQTFEIINGKIIIEDLEARKNIFDIFNMTDLYTSFMLFLQGLNYKSSLPFFVNIDARETYYDLLYNSYSITAQLNEISGQSCVYDMEYAKFDEIMKGKIPLYSYIQIIDFWIINIFEKYSDKLTLLNRNDEEIRVNFKDNVVVDKIIETDKMIQFSTKKIYSQYAALLKVNTSLCEILRVIIYPSLENYSEIKKESKKYIKILLSIYIWDKESLAEIINSKKINEYLCKYKNSDFLFQIKPLIACRESILILYAEIVVKIRILAEYLQINSEYHISVNESIEIYLMLDGACNRENFLFIAEKLGFDETERNIP